MTIIAVIPARGGSKRLPNKNIYPVFGKPMLVWSIEACQKSRYIDEIYVSTDHDKITEVATQFKAEVINRPAALSDDVTPKMEVIRHADQWYMDLKGKHPDIIVSVQANSPELRHRDLDKGIELLNLHDLWEVISVGPNHVQNASFRVIDTVCLYNRFLSAHIGVVENNCIDVHTLEDVKAIESKYSDVVNMTRVITS